MPSAVAIVGSAPKVSIDASRTRCTAVSYTHLDVYKRQVQVSPIKGSARTFHDREIDVLTVSKDGCDVLHRYFLTGGIDYLMDLRTATKVFSIVINK